LPHSVGDFHCERRRLSLGESSYLLPALSDVYQLSLRPLLDTSLGLSVLSIDDTTGGRHRRSSHIYFKRYHVYVWGCTRIARMYLSL